MIRPKTIPTEAGRRQCTSVLLVCLVLLGSLLAVGHGHDQLEVGDGDCVTCHLQQTQCFQGNDAPTLVLDRLGASCGATGPDSPVVDRPYLPAPPRGPPLRA
ncbi:MAG: hypothetical protein F4X59_08285 [Holophagales bacterium]|nr:hypothetical protein [Holophagales bacterium]MYC10118.1 hypothetical protein [Holophagales bacterium]